MYVTIPIEMAETVKLTTTPVGIVNLIMGIYGLGISSYIILLRSKNT